MAPISELESFFSQEALKNNFESLVQSRFDVFLKRPKISVGSDGIGLELFEKQLLQHLRAIERKVLQGRYTFSPLIEHDIPKSSSAGHRTISISTIKDSIVQRAIYGYLNPVIDPRLSNAVFGYRKGLNTRHAVGLIRQHYRNGLTFVFETDLKSFFDNIDHAYLLEKLRDLPEIDPRVAKLVFRFIKTHRIPFRPELGDPRKSDTSKHKLAVPRICGLPQGGVLSGMLSNLYLNEFDNAIISRHPGYVRYADDFIVCCESEEECRSLGTEIERMLPPGAELNLEKTVVCADARQGVEFIGFSISLDRLGVRKRNIGRFKSRINEVLESQWLLKHWQDTLDVLIHRLAYKINGPMDEELQVLADLGYHVAPYRRSWIGFFRCVDDYQQIKNLDHWIRRRITQFMWVNHRKKVNLGVLQQFGLPSLLNVLFKARKSQPLKPSCIEKDSNESVS